ncbi:hypothetical protein EDC24_1364 [Aquisalibacillus elongatus]|uniref:Uncharacterized protein n=2 Tax=Aquisalibacillus elongatus TaxID=485577 RepID=A0A3N5C3Z6_9BACI|nr:hypothetical protein EDC24_1364 [Aquisalibacillus elongatus]
MLKFLTAIAIIAQNSHFIKILCCDAEILSPDAEILSVLEEIPAIDAGIFTAHDEILLRLGKISTQDTEIVENNKKLAEITR